MPDLIIKPKNQSGNKLILQDQAGGAVLTTADSGATIGGATIINTSGAVTTTGAFTSQGIDANSTGPTGLTIASNGEITQNESISYQGGIKNYDFSFTGINTTVVTFDLTVPDIGYFILRSGYGTEQGIAYYHALHVQGNHNGTSVDSFVIADDHDTGSGALGNWNWGKDSSTNFYLTKTQGTYTNVIHGFVRFSTTTT